MEELRAFGRALANDGGRNVLPNLDAALRHGVALRVGVKIKKHFDNHGLCSGKIVATDTCESTLYPGEDRKAFTVKYDVDGTSEDLEEEEVRPLIDTGDMPERKDAVDALLPAFEYLERRLAGDCEANYSCLSFYEVRAVAYYLTPRSSTQLARTHSQVCRLVQVFDPHFAKNHLDPQLVDELINIKPIMQHLSISDLQAELPAYLAASGRAKACPLHDVEAYTNGVLEFWRVHTSEESMAAWRRAARIIFSFSPNSAACERVFSLLECMFGDTQEHMLADSLQVSLMLQYNGKKRSNEAGRKQ